MSAGHVTRKTKQRARSARVRVFRLMRTDQVLVAQDGLGTETNCQTITK